MKQALARAAGWALAMGFAVVASSCSNGDGSGSIDPDRDASEDSQGDASVPEADAGITDAGLDPSDAPIAPTPDGGPGPEPDAAPMGEPDADVDGPDMMAGGPPEDPGGMWGEPLGPPVAFGGCNAQMQAHRTEGNIHVTLCSNINYISNPPHSGNHYPSWAAYRTYTKPIPWGFLVHSLEHGAVVITYNCPQECADEVAQVQTFIDALPADCGASVKRRVILMPDPNLPVKFAASAWRHTLKADCFDRGAFQRFFDERYNKGREQSCNQGTDPTARRLCGL